MKPRFIVDLNVGKLAKWLRILGYDTLFFASGDDSDLLRIAFRENRIILTKDTHILERRVVTTGRLRAILVQDDYVSDQLFQVVRELSLDYQGREFSLCIECNEPLIQRSREDVQSRVPTYVFQSQDHFMECSHCHRLYWQGTHWQRMRDELLKLRQGVRL